MNTTHPLRNSYLGSWIHLSLLTSYTTTSTTPTLSLDLSLRQVPNTRRSPRRLLSTATNVINLGHIFLHLPDSLPQSRSLPFQIRVQPPLSSVIAMGFSRRLMCSSNSTSQHFHLLVKTHTHILCINCIHHKDIPHIMALVTV